MSNRRFHPRLLKLHSRLVSRWAALCFRKYPDGSRAATRMHAGRAQSIGVIDRDDETGFSFQTINRDELFIGMHNQVNQGLSPPRRVVRGQPSRLLTSQSYDNTLVVRPVYFTCLNSIESPHRVSHGYTLMISFVAGSVRTSWKCFKRKSIILKLRLGDSLIRMVPTHMDLELLT